MQRPVSLSVLTEYLGATATARLVAHFAGTCLKVPVRRQGVVWGRLVAALGENGAAEMQGFFAGEVLYIARNQAEEAAARRQAVRDMRAQGLSWAEIAHRLPRPTGPWSERAVRKMAAAGEADD